MRRGGRALSEPTASGETWDGRGAADAERGAQKPLVRNPLESSGVQPRGLVAVAAGLAVLALSEPSVASFALGLPLVLAGEARRRWAAGHLWKSRELIVSGPYAHVRHPLYVGTLACAAGFLVIAGPWVAAAGLPLFALFFFAYYVPYKERGEAKRLERRFGERFRTYRDAVPALLPRLHPSAPAEIARPDVRWRLSRVRDNDEVGTARLWLRTVASERPE